MSVELTAGTIPQLDQGAAGLAIDAAIRTAMQDTDDRGDDEKPRKVVITLSFRKEKSNVFTGVDVQTKIPAYRTAATVGKLSMASGRSALKFSPHSSDNPEQPAYPVDE